MPKKYDSHRWMLHGIQFEWSLAKAAANERKHGIDFETAAEVSSIHLSRFETLLAITGIAGEQLSA